MKSNRFIKFFLIILAVVIGISILIFGYNAYNFFKPQKIDSSKIEVQVVNGENDNEYIVTVNLKDNNISINQYSFDGGKNWQYENKYIVTDNKPPQIMLKDFDGNIIGEITKTIGLIDREGPVLKITLPAEIVQNSQIDLLSYVKAEDPSGIKDSIIVNPSRLDTSTLGQKKITYTAIDNVNNKTTIEVEINIVKELSNPNYNGKPGYDSSNESNQKNITYYRYRTKTVNSYQCNYYECDYKNTNDLKELKVRFDSNSYCCNEGSCNKVNQLVWPQCLPNENCLKGQIYEYKSTGNVCHKSNAIIENINEPSDYKTNCDSDEIKINDGYCHKVESVGNYPSGCTSSDCVIFNSSSPCGGAYNKYINNPCYNEPGVRCTQIMVPMYQKYKNYCYNINRIIIEDKSYSRYKSSCDSNKEISINGKCYVIDSKGEYYCESGYVKEGNNCVKLEKKTCSKTCTSEKWSSWSDWSTTKVVASDIVEVQTKTK